MESLRSDDFDIKIASGGGRMKITMDRYEADWSMVERGWKTHVLGEGRQFASAEEAITTYRNEYKVIDQDLPPFVIAENGKPAGEINDGDSVIFYDGTTLHCVAATGGNEWSYQIGTNADYDATEKRIVAWSGNDLYILNNRGRLIYNNKMSDTVQFASAGDEYVAVFVGEADNGVVSVINSSGQIVDNITVSNQTLLDIGFFMASTANNTQPTELMWMLGLNTTGTVLSTELQTFQPGKLSTGKSSIGEHIAYSIYDDNGTLNVVTTRQILHYSYRALEASSPTLIYGYTVEDVSRSGNTVYQLLVPAQEQSEGISIANVRLVYGGIDRVIHLPSACIAAKLGTKSVYGFSQNAVYACSFGDTTFRTYALPINVTAVLGMMNDNRAVVASGSEIYVVELPT